MKARIADGRPSRRVPKGSLSALARRLRISTRQLRRYCEQGRIEGAKQTSGGHWRVLFTSESLVRIRAALKPIRRRRLPLEETKAFKEFEVSLARFDFFGEPDSRISMKAALKMGDKRAVAASAIAQLYWEENRTGKETQLPMTGLDIAKLMGKSRATLYRWLRAGRTRTRLKNLVQAIARDSGDAAAMEEYAKMAKEYHRDEARNQSE